MRKTILLGVMLILMTLSVFAQGSGTANGNGNGEPNLIATQTQTQNGSMVQTQSGNMVQMRTSLQGLENAMLRVKEGETKDHIESVLVAIRAKRAEQYEKMIALKNLVIEENEDRAKVIVNGDGEAKLFGRFKWTYRYQYAINEQTGELVRDRKWYDFAFTEIQE